MRRAVILICCSCLACTRDNPAFDEALSKAGEDETDAQVETSVDDDDAEAEAEAENEESSESSESESESSEGPDDLPDEPACGFEPSAGLALRMAEPALFGGVCPNSINALFQITSVAADEVTFSVCQLGCTDCVGEYQLSAYPLIVSEHLPVDWDACVRVQASSPVGKQPSGCIWGAISVHDAESGLPYVIATSHSSPPTEYGAQVLGDLLPEPQKAGSCNCDEIGQGNNCCYAADGPPEFWYYPFDGEQLFPGDFATIDISTQAGVQHSFEVYQAERIPSCESHDLQLSWAVVIDAESP